jgi:hypothetical protein
LPLSLFPLCQCCLSEISQTFFLFSSPVESDSEVSSGIKWLQPPPDCSCGGSNRGPPYQIQRQSPLNQLTIDFSNL